MAALVSALGDELPDELVPYEDKLSKRFFTIRKQVANFILNEVRPREAEYKKQRSEMVTKNNGDHLRTGQPPVFFELQQAAKRAG